MDIKFHKAISKEDAKDITAFLLSEESFDDRNYTPGEIIHLHEHPLKSLKEEEFCYWYAKNEDGKIIAAFGVVESEQKTGGYIGDYIAINRHYRRQGIARKAIKHIEDYVKEKKGRFLVVWTCDIKEYIPVRELLSELEYEKIGYCPDYYYDGESMVAYYKRLT